MEGEDGEGEREGDAFDRNDSAFDDDLWLDALEDESDAASCLGHASNGVEMSRSDMDGDGPSSSASAIPPSSMHDDHAQPNIGQAGGLAEPSVPFGTCRDCGESHRLEEKDAFEILSRDANGQELSEAPTPEEVWRAIQGKLCAGKLEQRKPVCLARCNCTGTGGKYKLTYMCELVASSRAGMNRQYKYKEEPTARGEIRQRLQKFLKKGLGQSVSPTPKGPPQVEGPAEAAGGGSPAGSLGQGGGTRKRSGDHLTCPRSDQNLHRHAGAAESSAVREVRNGEHDDGRDGLPGGKQGGGDGAGNERKELKEMRDLKDALERWPWEAILLFYVHKKEKDVWSEKTEPEALQDFKFASHFIEELQEKDPDGTSYRCMRDALVKYTLEAIPESILGDKSMRGLFKYVVENHCLESASSSLEKPSLEKRGYQELFSSADDDESFYKLLQSYIGSSVKLHSAGRSNSWFIFLQMPSPLARMLLDTVSSITAVQDRLLDIGYRRIIDSQIEVDGDPGQALVCCYNIGKCPDWAVGDGNLFSGASIAQQHWDLVDQLSREYRGLHQRSESDTIEIIVDEKRKRSRATTPSSTASKQLTNAAGASPATPCASAGRVESLANEREVAKQSDPAAAAGLSLMIRRPCDGRGEFGASIASFGSACASTGVFGAPAGSARGPMFAGAVNPVAEEGASRAALGSPTAAFHGSEWEAVSLCHKLQDCSHQLAKTRVCCVCTCSLVCAGRQEGQNMPIL